MDLDPPEDIVMTPEEDLLCAVLRGEPGRWPGETPARLLAASRRHGVLALLYHQLKLTPAWTEWPLEIRQELARTAADQATRDLLRTRELSRVLAALAATGVEPLLMKGAALAYQLYPSPALRARQDADLLIREADLAATDRALAAGGYRQPGKETRRSAGNPSAPIISAATSGGMAMASSIIWTCTGGSATPPCSSRRCPMRN